MTNQKVFNCSDALVAALTELGVRCVFGMPGTQNVDLFESLRRSGIRTVLATSEVTAGFMANGWFRASGETGVFIAIAGPGFAWSLPALAEAALDSGRVLLITTAPLDRGYRQDLQVISQRHIAENLGCPVIDVNEPRTLLQGVHDAWLEASSGAPRAVVLQVSQDVMGADWVEGSISLMTEEGGRPAPCELPDDLMAALTAAKRPVVFAGSGVFSYTEKLERLIETTGAALLTTPGARGLISEMHPRSVGVDLLNGNLEELNKFLETSDLIIAIGCRMSHNGTAGFDLALPEERLAHVDIDRDVLQGNYKARWPLCMDAGEFLDQVRSGWPKTGQKDRAGWSDAEIHDWRQRIGSGPESLGAEPVWANQGTCDTLFGKIRGGLPDDSIVVTDSGQHQILARKYLSIARPRGLIFPCDFQSMGFGLPAAIGAALAVPDRPVVALIGDGSLQMVGSELVTAKREAVPLPVLVFSDGYLGQIRLQQMQRYGHGAATRLGAMDIARFTESLGVGYELADENLSDRLRASFSRNGPTVIEVKLTDGESLASIRKKARAAKALKSAIGPTATRLLRRLRR